MRVPVVSLSVVAGLAAVTTYFSTQFAPFVAGAGVAVIGWREFVAWLERNASRQRAAARLLFGLSAVVFTLASLHEIAQWVLMLTAP